MSSRPRLPPELCDQTIDHLWDDLDALRTCSLTCKDWLPGSRFHLFRNVRLRNADDVTRFCALLTSSPSVAHCVRKLSLSADYDGATPDGSPREDDGWVNSAASLFPMLHRVNTLALARVRWHALDPETRAAFATVFESVRQLFLFEVSFDASRDVIAFLSAFPALHDLYFQAVSWKHESPAPFDSPGAGQPRPAAGKMQLSYLFLDPKSSPTLVTEWLLTHPHEQRLQTIQLCWRELASTHAVGALLRASGSALEALHVEFPAVALQDQDQGGADAAAALERDLSLAANTGLRALHFGGLDARAGPARSRSLFRWVSAMLAQLRAPGLQEVSFALEVAGVADLGALDWARVDAHLSRDAFRGLGVTFYVACDREAGARDVRREIAERLPGFRARGSLSVSCI